LLLLQLLLLLLMLLLSLHRDSMWRLVTHMASMQQLLLSLLVLVLLLRFSCFTNVCNKCLQLVKVGA